MPISVRNILGQINCSDCGILITIENAVFQGTLLLSRCRECYRIKQKTWKNTEKYKYNQKKYMIKWKYGITIEQYNELLEFQQNACAICRKICKELYVDHNHKTGEVRGLLCPNCNVAIGKLYEDENIIWNMLEYLKKTWIEKQKVG